VKNTLIRVDIWSMSHEDTTTGYGQNQREQSLKFT
jgi:hypothetical protein